MRLCLRGRNGEDELADIEDDDDEDEQRARRQGGWSEAKHRSRPRGDGTQLRINPPNAHKLRDATR